MNRTNKWIIFFISFQIAWHWNSWINTGHSWCEKLCHKHKKQLNQFWLKKLTNSYFTFLSERCCTTEKRIQLKRELNVKTSIYCFYELLSQLCVSQWQWNKFCNKKSFSSCILINFLCNSYYFLNWGNYDLNLYVIDVFYFLKYRIQFLLSKFKLCFL